MQPHGRSPLRIALETKYFSEDFGETAPDDIDDLVNDLREHGAVLVDAAVRLRACVYVRVCLG